MKKTLLFFVFFVSFHSYGLDGNLCTVSLFSKKIDMKGDVIPGKNLGSNFSYEADGASSTKKTLVSLKNLEVYYSGMIDSLGFFKITFFEKKSDNNRGFLKNTIYYSPYDEDDAPNKPNFVMFSNYTASISCIN